jgi:hypothetical protein
MQGVVRNGTVLARPRSLRARVVALGAVGLVVAIAGACAAPAVFARPDRFLSLIGPLHEHTAYSDGWPGTRPADVFESAKRYGNDFAGMTDHSDNLGVPLVFSSACYGQGPGGSGEVLGQECLHADQVNPADSFRKWPATLEQAAAAATTTFTPLRGFEWSSQRYGHISVFFSDNYTNAYADGSLVDMSTFWSWFERPSLLGGGADSIATFDHPGAKQIEGVQGLNWNDFAYEAAADQRMVGIEVYNDKADYGTERDHDKVPEGYYVHTLDKGWHVGAIGAEDLGHRKPPIDNWGGPQWGKTVILARSRKPEDLKAALLARRFYAVGPNETGLRLTYSVGGAEMGSQIDRVSGRALAINATISDPSADLELVTKGGKVVGQGSGGTLAVERLAAAGEPWYFVRARLAGKYVAYSSPVWVRATRR